MIKALSIDDSRSVHALLTTMLGEVGIQLEHAYDGKSGLELIRKHKFDIILLDWEMPGWSGIETVVQIRAMGCEVPVLMLTSKNNPDDIMKALSLGANEYAMKPFVQDVLVNKIESALGRQIG